MFPISLPFAKQDGLPRTASRQMHRSNHPTTHFSDYWKKSLLIPYLDSLIMALNNRFSDENLTAFSLLSLHLSKLVKTSIDDLKLKMNELADFYQIPNLINEIELWLKVWKEKEEQDFEDIDLIEKKPKISSFALAKIALTLPCTTCTVERSFSSLRRIKTWLRSTMGEDRLVGKNHLNLL